MRVVYVVATRAQYEPYTQRALRDCERYRRNHFVNSNNTRGSHCVAHGLLDIHHARDAAVPRGTHRIVTEGDSR